MDADAVTIPAPADTAVGSIDVTRDYGRRLDYNAVVNGLRALNPGIHADMAGALGLWHPRIQTHAGLYHEGRHISAIDRGSIPEFKVWSVEDGWVEIDPTTVGSNPQAHLTFMEIQPDAPDYWQGVIHSRTYSQGYAMEDGVLKRYRGWVPGKVRGRILNVGWRHTFERVIRAGLPGLTREAIAAKFKVDLTLFIGGGTPEEIRMAYYANCVEE